jgi:hypothetical protein
MLSGLALAVFAGSAFAQENTPPAAAAAPTSPPPAVVAASGEGAGLGVGAVVWLSGLTGAQVVYDQSVFHLEGTLGYLHVSQPNGGPSNSNFAIGASGWYHLARGVNADLSLGGDVGLIYSSPAGGNSSTAFAIIPGIEARVFVTPNVALSGRAGISFQFGDSNTPTTITIGGVPTGAFSFTYFFR